MNARNAIVTSVVAILLLLAAAQSLGMFGGGSPTFASPASLLLVIPAFMSVPVLLVIFLAMVSFCAWCWQLFPGHPKVPLRSLVLFVVAAILSLSWYVVGWRSGLQYEGFGFTVACAVASAVLFVACGFMLWRARVQPSWALSLLSHAILFFWLFSYAFPYLGEGP